MGPAPGNESQYFYGNNRTCDLLCQGWSVLCQHVTQSFWSMRLTLGTLEIKSEIQGEGASFLTPPSFLLLCEVVWENMIPGAVAAILWPWGEDPENWDRRCQSSTRYRRAAELTPELPTTIILLMSTTVQMVWATAGWEWNAAYSSHLFLLFTPAFLSIWLGRISSFWIPVPLVIWRCTRLSQDTALMCSRWTTGLFFQVSLHPSPAVHTPWSTLWEMPVERDQEREAGSGSQAPLP